MATPYSSRDPAREDLTARARIRDAALAHFAEHGFKGASVRAIAKDAGVSPALVQHHFGTKDGLREACDAHLMAIFRKALAEMVDGNPQTPDLLGMLQELGGSFLDYLSRALVDGTPAATSMFEQFVDMAEEYLRALPADRVESFRSDIRTLAAVIVAMRCGVWVMRDLVAASLGMEELTIEHMPQVALAMFDIISPTLIAPELEEQVRRTITEDYGTSG